MASTLVDTNVLFDYLSEDEEWSGWSAAMLTDAAERGAVVINPIIYAEISVRYDRIEDVELALPREYFAGMRQPSQPPAFLAAKCFARYRKRGGGRRSPLLTSSSVRTQPSPGWLCSRDPRLPPDVLPQVAAHRAVTPNPSGAHHIVLTTPEARIAGSRVTSGSERSRAAAQIKASNGSRVKRSSSASKTWSARRSYG